MPASESEWPTPSDKPIGELDTHGKSSRNNAGSRTSTERTVNNIELVEPSSSSSMTPQTKVRFSLDTSSEHRAANSDNAQPTRSTTWNVDTATGARLAPNALPPQRVLPESSNAPALTPVQSRNRNRGYSLRRTLFAQKIEAQNVDHGMAIEMEPSASSSVANTTHAEQSKESKGPTVVEVEEDMEESEELPQRPVRLSDPAFDLPLYSSWLKKQRSLPVLWRHRFVEFSTDLRKRMLGPKEIPSSVDGRHVRVNVDRSFLSIDERTQNPYVGNSIRSCRYTPLNFVPRQLWAQFGKLANFYFLCVSLLQMVPGLSTTGTYTTIIPLLIFVSISMAKEGYEDLRRYRLDKEDNERTCMVLSLSPSDHRSRSELKAGATTGVDRRPDAWRHERWQDVRVGDVVLLERNCSVPADIVILHSSDPTNAAYIETKSLDGETNLKTKKPLPPIAGACSNESGVASLNAEFVVEDPNLDLYKFDGRVVVNGETLPLTNNEVIYRGSILRNTKEIYGLVIYSGEECKIRMNANKNPRIKAPALQFRVNRVVVIVACIVFFIAIITTISNGIWHKTYEEHAWYLQSAYVPFGHIFTSFVIMFNTMLPLSLYVSMEIVKVAQIYFMNDVDMYDPESDTPMEARTSTINEELGQVSYIFSDKTGTLTNNSMIFRKMSVAGTAWLHDQDLQDEAARISGIKLKHKKRGDKGKSRKSRKSSVKSYGDVNNVMSSARPSFAGSEWQPPTRNAASLHCGKTEEMLEYILHRPQSVFARKARFFLLGLALCHTCLPEKDDEGRITFQAASPDELALVSAAQDMGYIMTDRQSNTITVKTYPAGDEDDPTYETYEILDVIEFSSARKRMSIVVRLPDSRICIFTKGADTFIRKLLRLKDVAETNVVEIERRASVRKSMEAQAVIRRKSLAGYREGMNTRTSIGAVSGPSMLGRKSSVSLGQSRAVRQSIDHWLKDRETDVDLSVPRRSNVYYTPRPSAQVVSPAELANRGSLSSIDDARASFQTDDMDVAIDESVVINDNAIFERCFQHIDDFATEGLRTLLYGYRYLGEDEYRQWKEKYLDASTSIVDRQDKIEQVADLIECQFELLGATAIEDKLQDGVPDAIDRFRRAGIKMWMLTGDKRETAINIGHSCRLIKDYSTTIVLDHELGDLPSRMANAVADINSEKTAHSVLVIDGQTLTFVDLDPALKALFTDLAIAADSVICCRASPSQKAGLVKTIRTAVKGSVTLAIGDGANDIAMIQEAHLGIGIAGKEGLQAARTSDYSIAQFRFLLKLLLVHGRWNYIRVCKYTLGTFWKEMVFYIVQALYQRWNGYTGTSLYEPWSMSMFNTLFTSLPVIFMGVFEKDLTPPTLLAVPELYSLGRLNQGFNIRIYASWAVLGTTEAITIFFLTYSIYGEALFTRDNHLYAMGNLAFTACVTIISLKLQFFELHNKSVTAGLAMFLSVGGWWLWNLLLSEIYPHNVIYNVHDAFVRRYGKNLLWWLTLFIIVLAICLLEISIKSVKALLFPNDTEVFQAYERDLDIKKRFEESAADLLQQGWDRGTKRSSLEIARDEAQKAEIEALQAQREAEIQAILDRPRTMDEGKVPDINVRRRHSGYSEDPQVVFKVGQSEEPLPSKKSIDLGELFSKGYGMVRKDSMK